MHAFNSLAAAAFAAGTIASAAALTIDPAKHSIEGVRNARYCEIIPVVRSGFHLVATVYNTLGLNDCPAAVWDKITEAEMKKRFGAIKVLLNGPRYFVMDTIVAGGDTASGEKIEAAGSRSPSGPPSTSISSGCARSPTASAPSTATPAMCSRRESRCSCSWPRTASATLCRPTHR